jgi:hypothetical protein
LRFAGRHRIATRMHALTAVLGTRQDACPSNE